MPPAHCPVCGKASKELIFKHFVYQCLSCKHMFRDTKRFSYDYYEKSDYWYKDPEMVRLFRGKFAMLEDLFSLPCANSNCIEFGAADGHFLNLVRDAWPSIEINYNELVDRWGYDKRPHNTYIGTFEIVVDEILERIGRTFDNVVFLDVFEHIKHPHDTMSRLESITRPGSRVIILTDNGDCVNAENALLHYFEHMNIYTRKSWLELLKNHPFGIYYSFTHKEKTIMVLERT